MLAFAREGYRKFDIRPRDVFDVLTYPGALRMMARHWKTGLNEMVRSFSKRAMVTSLRRLVPDIEAHHLRAAPAGVRAQAVKPNGDMEQDFRIERSPGWTHVLNAPSPAATSSLAIGQVVADAALADI